MFDQTPQPSGGDAAAVFDRRHLARYTAGDASLEAELLSLFQDQAARCLGLMEAPADRASWRAAAHTLKGAARGVGAFELGDICGEAEELPEAFWPGARLRVAAAVEAALTAMGRAR